MGWKDLSAGVNDACLETFGEEEEVVYTPAGGSPIPVDGIYDEDYVAVDPESGLEVSSAQPNIFLRRADLSADPGKNDVVTLRGRTFKVIDWHPDSEGGGIAVLHEQ